MLHTLKTTPEIYFCKQNQTSYWGRGGKFSSKRPVPNARYISGRFYSTGCFLSMVWRGVYNLWFPVHRPGFRNCPKWPASHRSFCYDQNHTIHTLSMYISVSYSLSITLNTTKPWPLGRKNKQTKKILNVSRTKELSLQVWRSSIFYSPSEASSEAAVLNSTRISFSNSQVMIWQLVLWYHRAVQIHA